MHANDIARHVKTGHSIYVHDNLCRGASDETDVELVREQYFMRIPDKTSQKAVSQRERSMAESFASTVNLEHCLRCQGSCSFPLAKGEGRPGCGMWDICASSMELFIMQIDMYGMVCMQIIRCDIMLIQMKECKNCTFLKVQSCMRVKTAIYIPTEVGRFSKPS